MYICIICVCLSFCHPVGLACKPSFLASPSSPPPLVNQTVSRFLPTTYGFVMPSLPLALVSFLLGL